MSTEQEQKSSNKRFPLMRIILIIALGYFILAFHIAPGYGKVFMKEKLTLMYTVVTEEDVDLIIKRYNSAHPYERWEMDKEPFVKALRRVGILVRKDCDED